MIEAEGAGMPTPERIAQVRRVLGRRLAVLRDAAGLTQADLAAQVHYSRSTIGNVETGRYRMPRRFWHRCDRVLRADGVLLAVHDELAALIRRHADGWPVRVPGAAWRSPPVVPVGSTACATTA